MPNRILRESILTSDRVNALEAGEEVFYRRLMSVVDDYGRYDGRPNVVRAACYPLRLDKVREADVQRWMAACQKSGLVVLYDIDSKPYVQLLNLGEPRAKFSKYPDPPASARICAQAHASVPYSPSYSPSNAPTKPPKTPKGGGDALPKVPESLDSPEFQQAWAEWQEHRRQIRKKLTPLSVEQQFKLMESWGVKRAIEAIRFTIRMSWTGLREDQNGQTPRADDLDPGDARMIEEMYGGRK